MGSPALIVFSGLPGTGKTTIAREVARTLDALFLRIDSIEQTLRNSGGTVEAEGYTVAYAVAEDNLRIGRRVVADCVNPWELTRTAWRSVAARAGVAALDVEVVCSNADEHRRRVEARTADIPGHRLPTWPEVVAREYHPWNRERLIVDTSRADVHECVRIVVSAVRAAADTAHPDEVRVSDNLGTPGVRPATERDHQGVWSVLEPTIRAGETYPLPRDMTADDALAYWFAPGHETFVAERTGTIVGSYYLKANQQAGGSHVANCGYMVGPSSRSHGVGRAMCEHSLQRARARGFRAMQFNFVVSTNERAVRLWQSCGFEIVGRLPDVFEHPRLGLVDAFVMHRRL